MGDRWYDAQLGRWISADTIVPDPANPQSLNRFAYVYNNPLRYTDPTGHFTEDEIMQFLGLDPEENTWEDVLSFFEEGGQLEGRWGWIHVLRRSEVGDRLKMFDDEMRLLFDGRFDVTDYGSLVLRGTFYGGKEEWEGYETTLRHEDVARWGSAAWYKGYFTAGIGGTLEMLRPTDKYTPVRYDFGRVDKAALLRDGGGIVLGILEFSPYPPVAVGAWGIGLGVDIASLIEGRAELKAKGWPPFWESPLDHAGMGADFVGMFPWAGIGGDATGIGISLLEGLYRSP